MMTTDPRSRFRLFYVDDSGSPATGMVVYGWLECEAAAWRSGLESWLSLRRTLDARYGIPPAFRLHAANFAGGHSNPSTNPAWNRRKGLRWEAMELILAHIAATKGIQIGTVYRATTARRHAYATHRADACRRLVTRIV